MRMIKLLGEVESCTMKLDKFSSPNSVLYLTLVTGSRWRFLGFSSLIYKTNWLTFMKNEMLFLRGNQNQRN